MSSFFTENNNLSVWVVTEGLIGTENQCLGVAEALGVTPIVKRVKLNEPWASLSPYLGLETAKTFQPSGDSLAPPWPDILIASGRKAIAASRFIKEQSQGKTFTVQIQDPRFRRGDFDLVVVPEHDPARGKNVFVTTASPNRITTEKLSSAKEKFKNLLNPLPSPRIAILIGGSTNTQTLTADITQSLAEKLKTLAENNYGLMITASRRTGVENEAIIRDALKNTSAYIWDGKTENPYFGFLAWADAIIATGDSMSMVSESATTGKPVYVVPLSGSPKKRHIMLAEKLKSKGIVRDFTGQIEHWTYDKLNDAEQVAIEIRRKSGLFAK